MPAAAASAEQGKNLLLHLLSLTLVLLQCNLQQHDAVQHGNARLVPFRGAVALQGTVPAGLSKGAMTPV